MDAADYAALTDKGFFPRTLVIDVASDADIADVSEAVSAQVGGPHTVQSLDARTAAIQSSPAVSALRTALLIALVLAVALSVVAVLLVAGVSRDARSRVIALLRTMGMSRRQGRGIVAWEFAPLGLSALVGGLILGVVLPLLVLVSIDLRPFTGGIRQPGLTVDPVLTAGLIAAVVIALVIAVIGGVLTARTTSLVTVLRTEEDR
ncbi:FtsX-like permease family protein [Microbacterium sp. NIBRBAC000506063]|uniref:FtsX-like permease family protein n=1 Tax=Microbacterium sp. NIBRBAC000506063 TaxID=2734618 RepID=UPI002948C3CC|nr:FtsX-like permease family protein [Microbacterium sp. NIBRBAC000506063]